MTPRFAIIERQVWRTHISGPYDSAEEARAVVKGLQVVDVQSGARIEYEVVELVAIAAGQPELLLTPEVARECGAEALRRVTETPALPSSIGTKGGVV